MMKNLLILHNSNNAVVNYLVWSFFSILVYRVTGRIDYIFLTMALLNIGGFCGFLFGTFAMRFLQTNTIFILSNMIQGTVILLMLISLDKFAVLFGIFSFLRGVGTGLAMPGAKLFLLKDIHELDRSAIINIIKSATLGLGVFVPIVSGFILVRESGYELVFLIGSIFSFAYLLTVITQVKHSPTIPFDWADVKDVLRKPKIKVVLALKSLEQAAIEVFISCMTIVPFLLIGSEFGVGGLKSGAILFSAIVIFLIRSTSLNIRFGLGSLGALVDFVGQAILVVFWTVPALVIRQVIHELSAPFRDTVKSDIAIRIDENILGSDLEEESLEITFINVILGYVAKTLITFLGFILIANVNISEIENLLRVLLITSSFAIFIVIFVYKFLLQKVGGYKN